MSSIFVMQFTNYYLNFLTFLAYTETPYAIPAIIIIVDTIKVVPVLGFATVVGVSVSPTVLSFSGSLSCDCCSSSFKSITLTTLVPFTPDPSFAVAVIVTCPFATPVIKPFSFTVAILLSLDVQVTFLFEAFDGSTVTVKFALPAIAISSAPLIVILVTSTVGAVAAAIVNCAIASSAPAALRTNLYVPAAIPLGTVTLYELFSYVTVNWLVTSFPLASNIL